MKKLLLLLGFTALVCACNQNSGSTPPIDGAPTTGTLETKYQ